MYALLVKQLQPSDENWHREGHLLSDGRPPYGAEMNVWRALDDDRIPYYIIIADNDGIEAMFEWAAKDVGVTIIQSATYDDNGNVSWTDALS
jgi:hypothetical protein